MTTKLVDDALKYLPLRIEQAEWNDPIFNIWGENWAFCTVSSWRITNNDTFTSGCYDKDILDVLKEIKNTDIILIEFQSNQLRIDPIFILSNGYKIEVFSTTFYEPWTCKLPSEMVYVASPSDPNW